VYLLTALPIRVSIHAPLVGGELRITNNDTHSLGFNPLAPAWGRPYTYPAGSPATRVSIHAPAWGGDSSGCVLARP
jgi:hypothetical protein